MRHNHSNIIPSTPQPPTTCVHSRFSTKYIVFKKKNVLNVPDSKKGKLHL